MVVSVRVATSAVGGSEVHIRTASRCILRSSKFLEVFLEDTAPALALHGPAGAWLMTPQATDVPVVADNLRQGLADSVTS